MNIESSSLSSNLWFIRNDKFEKVMKKAPYKIKISINFILKSLLNRLFHN